MVLSCDEDGVRSHIQRKKRVNGLAEGMVQMRTACRLPAMGFEEHRVLSSGDRNNGGSWGPCRQ